MLNAMEDGLHCQQNSVAHIDIHRQQEHQYHTYSGSSTCNYAQILTLAYTTDIGIDFRKETAYATTLDPKTINKF